MWKGEKPEGFRILLSDTVVMLGWWLGLVTFEVFSNPTLVVLVP